MAANLVANGHSVMFTIRLKECTFELLKPSGFTFKSIGNQIKLRSFKPAGLAIFSLRIFCIARRFMPDVFISHGSMYAALVAFALRKPHISIEDTFNSEQMKFYMPFTKVLITGNYEHPYCGNKEIKVPAIHELLYLMPKYFKPDIKVIKKYGLSQGERYTIIRLVSRNASHDMGIKGMSTTNLREAIMAFAAYGKVLISSEVILPTELESYRINPKCNDLHHLLAFSSLVFGESATVAAEAAVLGRPSIYIDDIGRYYTKYLETEFGLVYNYFNKEIDFSQAIDKGVELLRSNISVSNSIKQRNKMLQSSFDYTLFLTWLIENYSPNIELSLDSTSLLKHFATPYINDERLQL